MREGYSTEAHRRRESHGKPERTPGSADEVGISVPVRGGAWVMRFILM